MTDSDSDLQDRLLPSGNGSELHAHNIVIEADGDRQVEIFCGSCKGAPTLYSGPQITWSAALAAVEKHEGGMS